MDYIELTQNYKIIVTSKKVDWLVKMTEVRVFDAVSFEGYQRQINPKHCQKIVDYLEGSFHLPGAIICACARYSDDEKLYIVDGQHRVKAFELLKESDPQRYKQISDMEMPVVVMVGVPLEVEIDTFITINKTSKKVDTSLAYVLKSKLSLPQSGDMAMPKAEYVAVESAMLLNSGEVDSYWAGNILFEGVVKLSDCLISLNAFVRVTRVFVNTLSRVGLIDMDWYSQDGVTRTIRKVASIISFIWGVVFQKWPELLSENYGDREIIQGAIGYTAITRAIVRLIKDEEFKDIDAFYDYILNTIMSFGVSYQKWLKTGDYAHYSSEYGYKLVADELVNSVR